jgi:hypothetical protein
MATVESPQPQIRKRSIFLRVMLILWMIYSAISACNFFRSLSGTVIAYTPLHHPTWAVPPLGLLSILNFVCVVAIWKWKKWGMYGLAASGAVIFTITLISLGIINAVISVSGVIIIGLLVRAAWRQME